MKHDHQTGESKASTCILDKLKRLNELPVHFIPEYQVRYQPGYNTGLQNGKNKIAYE
jgi:hypothetical protein